jgi:hypothetical protein
MAATKGDPKAVANVELLLPEVDELAKAGTCNTAAVLVAHDAAMVGGEKSEAAADPPASCRIRRIECLVSSPFPPAAMGSTPSA